MDQTKGKMAAANMSQATVDIPREESRGKPRDIHRAGVLRKGGTAGEIPVLEESANAKGQSGKERAMEITLLSKPHAPQARSGAHMRNSIHIPCHSPQLRSDNGKVEWLLVQRMHP